jgi:hypothetical protein
MILCELRAISTEENLGVLAIVVVGQLKKGVDKERPKQSCQLRAINFKTVVYEVTEKLYSTLACWSNGRYSE